MSKKKGSEKNPSSQAFQPQPPKRTRISGNDCALTIPITQGTSLDLSYWDLWFSIVAALRHDGDLNRLANQLWADR
jgi:hypothetical protein